MLLTLKFKDQNKNKNKLKDQNVIGVNFEDH